MTLISCKKLSLAYESNIVVTDVDFSVNKGDYICIVGENGSGKSTLIKSLLGLKKPLRGEIAFSPELKQSEIGYLPQQSNAQKEFPASVQEVVLSGCLNKMGSRPYYTKEEKASAQKNMMLLDIDKIYASCFSELSGGQQQRVLLARALCATSKLLLLDEPASGLDQIAASELFSFIKILNEQHGLTVIMISHDISFALENANKILHLKQKQLFFGSSEQYKKSNVYKSLFFGGENFC